MNMRLRFSLTALLIAVGLWVVILAVFTPSKQERAIREIESYGGNADIRDHDGKQRTSARLWKWSGGDDGLHAFQSLPKIIHIHVHGASGITDRGLVILGDRLDEAEIVTLRDTSVSDEGCAELKRCTELRELDLTSTKITDAGLVHLSKLKQLEVLRLGVNPITDKGLIALRGLPRLKLLYLGGTQVTRQGIKELHEALPNLESVEPPH